MTATRNGPASRTSTPNAAGGRAARAEAPRSSHAEWTAPADRSDPVDILEAQAIDRVPELVPIRYGRMLTSPLAFYRGAAAIMAADLARTPRSGLDVQLCGDAHLSNFGGFASPERSLVFDVNDFDETHPGPWEWDVKRLAASLAIAGRERDLDAKRRRAIVVGAVSEYRRAIREYAAAGSLDVWYSRVDAASLVARWGPRASRNQVRAFERNLAKARGKDSIRAFAKLTHEVNGERRIISDPPLITPIDELLADEARSHLDDSMAEILRSYVQNIPSDRRRLIERFRIGHAARKVVGVGSVGTRAWVVLMLDRENDDPLFLQFKEAQASVVAPFVTSPYRGNQGQRVVEGQTLMQAASDILLGWTSIMGPDGIERDFYVRQLWDSKLSPSVESMSPETMAIFGEICGRILARAHSRSGDRSEMAAYLGSGRAFDHAVAEFSERYADQNEEDYEAFQKAVATKRLAATAGL